MVNQLILASESPRRKELLTQTGIPFEAIAAHADELKTGDPIQVVTLNAAAKAQAVSAVYPDRPVLGADTIVYLNGRIFGKPGSAEEAKSMLRSLSDQWHQVYTGVALVRDGILHTDHAVTDVHFVHLSEEAIDRYIATGEPFDKAGAYAIQGRAGCFIDRIEGSYSNVIGLPLTTVMQLLGRY